MDKPSDEKVMMDDYPKFEFRTAGEFTDGGYEGHYRFNTINQHDQSNHVGDIHKMTNVEHTEPYYKCPKCEGPNLFRTIHESYYECEDCDVLIERSELAPARKKFQLTVDENGDLKVKDND